MLSALTRLFRRPASAPAVRSMEAAAGGRRWSGVRDTPSSLSALHAGRVPVMRRARNFYLNNALARSGIDGWVSALVGTGIKTQSGHPDATVRERLGAAFEAWTDDADADGRGDFYALQALVALLLVRDGEAFVVEDIDEAGRLRLKVHDADMVAGDLTSDLGEGRFILQGVEHDAAGRAVAYHFRRQNPGLPFAAGYGTVRVPAERVRHIFRRDTAGQVRGVPWLAPAMLRLSDLDASNDAELMRQKVAALVAGFVINAEGAADPMTGDAPPVDGVQDISMEPGEMKVLLPGQDVRFSEPARIGAEAIDFKKMTRQEIAAALGIPAHILDGDLTAANYSSLRAALVEWRRRVETYQHGILAFQLLRPVWRKWAALEALSGRLAAPDFFREPAPYLAATFVPPRSEWVDPAKDVEAEIAAIGARLMSRRQAVAARGLDVEALDREIAADRAREARLGLDAEVTP